MHFLYGEVLITEGWEVGFECISVFMLPVSSPTKAAYHFLLKARQSFGKSRSYVLFVVYLYQYHYCQEDTNFLKPQDGALSSSSTNIFIASVITKKLKLMTDEIVLPVFIPAHEDTQCCLLLLRPTW